ncbi:hypothetical protein MNBD_ACTINO02-2242 [hydrothermal vent metagenome]|uniref:DUF4349 domain-containing protein n=1 Tax=hydrothermal vent metagenome TaxID=652676 RepID=A0A3B0S3M8_9ZZZZ
MKLTTRAGALLILLLAIFAAACSGSSNEAGPTPQASGSTATMPPAVQAEGDAGGADEAASTVGKVLGDGALPVVLQVGVPGRNIIFAANLSVAVDDVPAASREAISVVSSLGGFLFTQQTTGAPEATSTLTFKVQPGDFQQILEELGSIGKVRNQTITADDVTERIVDLESRITTAEASVERLRGFLEKAEDVTTVTDLETQLLARETDLETMRGQLRTIQNRVDLATIVVTLTEALSRPEITVVVTAYPGTDGGASCPASSGVSVDEGAAVTVCWEITNTGDTALTDIGLSDNVLDIDIADVLFVFGDPGAVLETGQSLVLATEVELARDIRTQTRIVGVPVDQEGNRLEGRDIATTQGIFLDAVDPGGLPGFGDSFDTSVDALRNLLGLVVLAAGAALPFFWVPIVGWLVLRRRSSNRLAGSSAGPTDGPGRVAGPTATDRASVAANNDQTSAHSPSEKE